MGLLKGEAEHTAEPTQGWAAVGLGGDAAQKSRQRTAEDFSHHAKKQRPAEQSRPCSGEAPATPLRVPAEIPPQHLSACRKSNYEMDALLKGTGFRTSHYLSDNLIRQLQHLWQCGRGKKAERGRQLAQHLEDEILFLQSP